MVDVSDRPFALPPRELITTILDLPVPISVNKTRRLDIRSLRAKAIWEKQADKMLMAAGPWRNRKKINGKFEVKIVLDERFTKIDLDNSAKFLIDNLRRLELITNDGPKYMRRVVIEWGNTAEGCRVTIQELI